MPYFALFDDAVSGRAKLYQNHVESHRFYHNELDSLTSILQAGWKKGLHAVLFVDYEFGLPLMDIPSGRSGSLRLHWFADCSEIDAESWLANHSDGLAAGISTPRFSVSEADYLEHINQIHEAIRRGDTYQSITPSAYTCKLTAIRFSFTAACASLCHMPFCLVCPTGQGRKRGLCVFLPNFSSKSIQTA